jgi:NADPH-dependent 7-cyano-7-deazaguanine reductase QueF
MLVAELLVCNHYLCLSVCVHSQPTVLALIPAGSSELFKTRCVASGQPGFTFVCLFKTRCVASGQPGFKFVCLFKTSCVASGQPGFTFVKLSRHAV